MLSEAISILIIDENKSRSAIIEAGLRDAGYHNLSLLDSFSHAAAFIEMNAPDVIVIDLENPNRDMLEAFFALSRSVKRPIAMFVDKADEKSIEAAIDAGVSAYVVDGLTQDRVRPILNMAISRFRAFSKMEKELEDARNELADRKVIDHAKRILMKNKNLSEDEAYKLLRSTAMRRNQKISEIAQSLVTAYDILE